MTRGQPIGQPYPHHRVPDWLISCRVTVATIQRLANGNARQATHTVQPTTELSQPVVVCPSYSTLRSTRLTNVIQTFLKLQFWRLTVNKRAKVNYVFIVSDLWTNSSVLVCCVLKKTCNKTWVYIINCRERSFKCR